MGYAKKSKEIKAQLKKNRHILHFAVALAVLLLVVVSAFVPYSTWKYYFALPKVGERKEGELRLHFIDVGQGDSTFIEFPDGRTMLIDGGDGSETTAKAVLRYLNALDVEYIDYVLLTHADSDHCGSLDTVLEYKEVGKVFLPLLAEGTENDEYESFFAAVMKEGCAYEYADRNKTLDVGADCGYTFAFLYPYAAMTEGAVQTPTEENETSVVVWLDYMGASALLTGDAPATVEETLIADDELQALARYGVDLTSTEILKVAHHGSEDSTSDEFLAYLGADTAIVSCGVDNPYSHPSERVTQSLVRAGAATYRTDTHGSVIVTVDKTGARSVKTLGK